MEESRRIFRDSYSTNDSCHWPLLEHWVPASEYPACRSPERARAMYDIVSKKVMWRARNR